MLLLRAAWGGAALLVLLSRGGAAVCTAAEPPFRLPLPDRLPPHPRVACTQADLERVRRRLAEGDPFVVAAAAALRTRAESANAALRFPLRRLTPAHFSAAADLARAGAVLGNETWQRRALAVLRECARIYPTLKTTSARGRVTDSTLREAPLALAAAEAWDLIASAPFVTPEDRRRIERDLLFTMGWECGHRCRHPNSSNWRAWALAIIGATGFAIGDRRLIDECINGVQDPDRRVYLYGLVQFLTHSVFADGIHWERSMGYTYYTFSALEPVLNIALRNGIDLWRAELPGIVRAFPGCADHEFGPPGPRSIRAMLDAPFYFAFPGGALPQIGDSNQDRLAYHFIYESAWRTFRDPKYAWLVHRERSRRRTRVPFGWHVWMPRGRPEGRLVPAPTSQKPDNRAFRMVCRNGDRLALVQDVNVPTGEDVRVSARVVVRRLSPKAAAHVRCNVGARAFFTQKARPEPDVPQHLTALVPADALRGAAGAVRLRVHVFLENGAGTVEWDDIQVRSSQSPERNLAINGDFDMPSSDGRALDFRSLVATEESVPPGEYDLGKDARIGLTGRNVDGCTLFPEGGFAVLRADARSLEAPAVNVSFGPYGSGHDHPDRLQVVMFANGRILSPDAGSWGYDNPMHLTWANQTVAHNTLVVDEVSQEPQGRRSRIFASESGGRRVYGVLEWFRAAPPVRVVRVTCDTAYPGVHLDRTVVVTGAYVLDVFRAESARAHTYDLPWHGLGRVRPVKPNAVRSLDGPLSNAFGYRHFQDIRRVEWGRGRSAVAEFFEEDGPRPLFRVRQRTSAGAPETYLARTPARSGVRSVMLTRVRARSAWFAAVLDSGVGTGGIAGFDVRRREDEGILEATVRLQDGAVHRFRIPRDPERALRWEMAGPGDEKTSGEIQPGVDPVPKDGA